MRRFENSSLTLDGGNRGMDLATARSFGRDVGEEARSRRLGLSIDHIDRPGLQTVSRVPVGDSGLVEEAGRVVLFPDFNGGGARRDASVRVRP